ncbi:transmembrane protein 79-like [Heptranchias perlo]|uniref:transmembrane protein 79-like n=1 Tax=Heptranchias perlo TaxID=212740 RepID=UPI0035593C75
MSAFLPSVWDDPPSLTDKQDVSGNVVREPSVPDDLQKSVSSEDGVTGQLHASSTLEYSHGDQRPVATEIEMATFADGSAGPRPEAEASDEQVAGEPVALDLDEELRALEPLKEGEPRGTAPLQGRPGLRVCGSTPTAGRMEEEEEEEEGVCTEKPAGNESSPFLTVTHGSQAPAGGNRPPDVEWLESDGETGGPNRRPCPGCSRASLKATAALAGSLIIYPCFLYGAYVFLPFDVPLMSDLSARMLYTLRCSVFATVPIMMGIIVYGLARLCSSSIDPFRESKDEVEIHLRFVTDSIHLFVLFLVNLVVLSTYLPQEVLKLLPLLTAFFALARLIYWLTFAISSTFRGFGYGLTFFPILGLLVCNLCYMFILAPDKLFATSASETQEEKASGSRQRFWG